ncbi:PAS domain S-box protein [Lichenibacterium dinghuense]|uniref:PAS domain S-box protein n=1 Tax=Lichenibacterium dinghuense TaxID=2895977 RepID=UPI001F3EB9FF|nr:PAS domain S-box protein [Lichenibacterium sp. 6Y81]
MTSTHDIAELNRRLAVAEEAAAALRESGARHRLLVGSWAQAVWETDPAGVVVADSPNWRAYTGQTLEEWLGRGWLDAIHSDDRPYAERRWREATAARRCVDAEFRLRSPGGGWRWTNVRAAPVLDASGDIEEWVGMSVDIDDRKRAEETLSQSEGRLRTLFDSIDEGYAEFDVIFGEDGLVVDWRYVTLNAAFTRLTGMEDVTGRLISEIVPELEPEWRETYTRVLETGEPIRFEQAAVSLDQWYEVYASRSGGPGSCRIVVVYNNITERKRAEIALREGEERQAFLLKLSDTLRGEQGVDAVAERAVRMVADRLALDRFYLVSIDGDHVVVTHETRREHMAPILGSYRGSDFPAAFEEIFGRTIAYDDVATDPGLTDLDRRSLAGLGAGSLAAVAVRRGGERMIWAAGAISSAPRRWTAADLALLEDVTERTWAAVERARTEAALQESEARFAQFAASSSDALWIRDAATLAMEYASPAIAAIYGVPPDALLGDPKRWASLIVPEDRDAALEHLEQARRGEAVVHEFRIQRPSDGVFRWIRNTDFPLRADGHVPRIGGIAHDATDEKLAAEHQGVLLAELQHRVRNIMAIVRAIASRSAERAGSVPEYAEILAGRLLAFSRVQALLTRAANVSVGLRTIVMDEISV